jgi:HD-like signal output (HDOD) protein/CheY-like chemotaxis protein
MDEKRILLADADPQALDDFCQALGQKWSVTGVTTGSEALTQMKERPYDVLVADLNLPGLKDAQLLNRIRAKYPSTVRIIAAAEADRDRVVKRALGAHQFLPKPFDKATLKETIERALALDAWINNDRIRELAARVRTLPTIPSLYLDIIAALKSPSTTTKDVGAIIAQDMAMMTKLLQVVNSAYFGLEQRITDPAEAVGLLGFETIKSMVMAIKLLGFYDKLKPGYFSIEALWHHSTAVAQTAKEIVLQQNGDRSMAETAFAAGLMHDLGKVVLAANFDEQYLGVQSLARKQQIPVPDIEREIFGATHGEIGAYMLGLWGMPIDFLEVAALHHAPSHSGNKDFRALTAVHVANVLEHEKAPDQDGHVTPQMDEGYLVEIGMLDRLAVWRRKFGKQEVTPPAEPMGPPVVESGIAVLAPSESTIAPETADRTATSANISLPVLTVALSERNPNRRRRQPAAILAVAAIVLLVALFLGPSLLTRLPGKSELVRAKQTTVEPVLTTSPAAAPISESPPEPSPSGVTQYLAQEPVTLPDASVPPPASAPAPKPEPTSLVVEKPAPSEPAFPDLRLQGLLLSSRNPSAIINGKTLRENDLLAGARLIEIGRSNVVMEFQKTRKTLKLNNPN